MRDRHQIDLLIGLLKAERENPLAKACKDCLARTFPPPWRDHGAQDYSDALRLVKLQNHENELHKVGIRGFQPLLSALEAAAPKSKIRAFTIQAQPHEYIAFTDEGVSILFGVLEAPTQYRLTPTEYFLGLGGLFFAAIGLRICGGAAFEVGNNAVGFGDKFVFAVCMIPWMIFFAGTFVRGTPPKYVWRSVASAAGTYALLAIITLSGVLLQPVKWDTPSIVAFIVMNLGWLSFLPILRVKLLQKREPDVDQEMGLGLPR